MIWWSDDDLFDRFAVFMNIGNYTSQKEIFELIRGFYPEKSRFIVHSMDMEYMKAGKPAQLFEKQLEELAAVARLYPDTIYPFICADPRRDAIADLVKEYIEEQGFRGIKLYPSLGFYPFDERLEPVFEYAEKNSIPVTAHCSRGGIYYRGSITDDMLVHPKTGKKLEETGNKTFTDNFANPHNYSYVLEKFPELKICLAHFGGDRDWKSFLTTPWDSEYKEENWYSTVRKLIKTHKKVYADIAYTAFHTDLLPLVKVTVKDPELRERILYGSDYYMVEQDMSDRAFGISVRAFLGEDDFIQIAETNPRKFLFV